MNTRRGAGVGVGVGAGWGVAVDVARGPGVGVLVDERPLRELRTRIVDRVGSGVTVAVGLIVAAGVIVVSAVGVDMIFGTGVTRALTSPAASGGAAVADGDGVDVKAPSGRST